MKIRPKKMTWVVIAILVIAAVIGIGYYFVDAGYIDEWPPNQVAKGAWNQDVILNYVDGSSTSLANDMGLFSVAHDNIKVTSTMWKIQARATTPTGADPWDNIEIDLSGATITSKYLNGTAVLWTNSESPSVTSIIGAIDGIWFDVADKLVDFTTVADDSWVGGDTFTFSVVGTIQFRGTTATETGDWIQTTLPDSVSFTLRYIEKELFLEWGDGVDWDGGDVDYDDTLPKTGDMNGDGNLNSADVLYLSNYIAGTSGYEILHANADVDCTGTLNDADCDYLSCYLTGNPICDPLYPTCGGSSGTTVELAVADVSILPNGATGIPIYIHNAVNVGSCDFKIKFSNTDFAFNGVLSGTMGCTATTYVDGAYLVVFVTGYTTGSIDGDATLCTINIDGQNAIGGLHNVPMFDTLLFDATPQSNAITHTTIDGTITVN